MLRAAARKAKAAHLFTRASTLYERARGLYLQAGAKRPARACLTAMQDIFMYVGTYSRTRAEMLEVLSAMYPSVPEEQRAAWLDLPSTESLRWDGVKHYYYDVPINLANRDVELFQTLPDHVAGYQRQGGVPRVLLRQPGRHARRAADGHPDAHGDLRHHDRQPRARAQRALDVRIV